MNEIVTSLPNLYSHWRGLAAVPGKLHDTPHSLIPKRRQCHGQFGTFLLKLLFGFIPFLQVIPSWYRYTSVMSRTRKLVFPDIDGPTANPNTGSAGVWGKRLCLQR